MTDNQPPGGELIFIGVPGVLQYGHNLVGSVVDPPNIIFRPPLPVQKICLDRRPVQVGGLRTEIPLWTLSDNGIRVEYVYPFEFPSDEIPSFVDFCSQLLRKPGGQRIQLAPNCCNSSIKMPVSWKGLTNTLNQTIYLWPWHKRPHRMAKRLISAVRTQP